MPAHDRRVTGTVVDQQNLPVRGARVSITQRQGSFRQTTVSPADFFTIEGLAPALYDIRVEADGFGPWEGSADVRTAAVASVEARLLAAGVAEQIIVTPTRSEQLLGNVPASVSVLTREEIARSPAVVADDVLRQVPAFSLFRRTSSLAAHPTAQGVSLRGIGPSGVSRTLVLLDSVPFNDPFGGWAYWTRVPLQSVDRIEIVEGPSSSLYGNYAMGGVINIMTGRPTRRTLELKPQYGSRNSPKLDFFASDVWRGVGVAVDGSFFDTEGYPIVAEEVRGRVDTKAAVNFANLNLKLEHDPTDRMHLFFRGSYFREERDNAKVSTITGAPEANDTTWTSAGGGVNLRLPDQSQIQARLFADMVTLKSNFLAVPVATPPRSIGRTTLNQRVPTDALGGMVEWSKAFAQNHALTVGTDWRWVDGDSNEQTLDFVTGTRPVLSRISGGSQTSVAFFVQDVIVPMPDLQLVLSARLDHWRNYDGHNLETTIATGLPTPNNALLDDRDDTVVSPRAAVLYHLTDRVSAWGAVSSGFRAPTLNELYRQFRVGTVLTLANNTLGPERLVGGEAGLNVAPTPDTSWRITWFDNRVSDPVSNVTRSISPALITRQRDNLGRTRIRGFQTDLEYRAGPYWRLGAGYLLSSATVREYAADPTLVGNVLPQVPRHRGSAQVSYSNPSHATVALLAQFVGSQFDDDQNRFSLDGYAVADLLVSRQFTRRFEVFFGVQNLFDTLYNVGTNPSTIGTPRLVNGGLRVRFGS